MNIEQLEKLAKPRSKEAIAKAQERKAKRLTIDDILEENKDVLYRLKHNIPAPERKEDEL